MGNGGYTGLTHKIIFFVSNLFFFFLRKKGWLNKNKKCRMKLIVHGELKSVATITQRPGRKK